MPNVKLFSFARPERPVKTRVFTDPAQPEFALELSFRPIDALDAHAAADIQIRFIETYVTGDEIAGTPPADFPFVGGQPVTLSKALCANCANLVAQQSPTKEDGSPNASLWEFEDFVAMSVTLPAAWVQILAFAKEVNQAQGTQKKIGSPESGAKPSDSASATISDTPNSTSESMPSSALSTLASETFASTVKQGAVELGRI